MKVIEVKYFVAKGKHKANPRPKHFWFNKRTFDIELSIDSGWYREDELNDVDGVSKIKGITFGIHFEKPLGKVPIIKNLINSILIGCKASIVEGVWELWVRGDNRGKEFQYKVGHVEQGKRFKVIFTRRKGYVNMLLILPNMTTNHKFEMNTLPFGYLLNTYFGGRSYAVRNFVTWTKTIIRW